MAELKRKVTIRRKEAPKEVKKSKWWLWLLLVGVILVGVIFFVKNNASDSTDKSLIAKTEQTTTKANEIIVDVQNGTMNFDEAQSKVDAAQKEVDVAKAAAKTNEEKQAVAVAQAKVDEAVKAVETSKQVAQPLESDKTGAPEERKNGTTTPVETSTPKDATNQKTISTTTTQGSQGSSKKQRTNSSSQSNVPNGSIEEKARQVIRGDFGNGLDRKNALGSEYNAIQSKVNEIYLNKNVR